MCHRMMRVEIRKRRSYTLPAPPHVPFRHDLSNYWRPDHGGRDDLETSDGEGEV